MNINNQKELHKSALEHKTSPNPNAWNRIQKKLEQDKKVFKIQYKKYMWLAAVFVAIMGVLTVFNSDSFSYNDVDTSSSTQVYSEHIELLDINNDPGIYEIQKLADLKIAYKKLSEKSGM